MAGSTFPRLDKITFMNIWKQRLAVDPAWRTILISTSLTVIFIAGLALVQFATPNLAGTDDHYHLRFAQLMRTEGLKPAFPWLPLTILSPQEFYDHHFLFHVGLIPFTVGDLVLGGKWASVLFASLAFLSVWWLLHNQRVPYAWLWALGLLAVSSPFLYRMSMIRAQSLALAVMMFALYLLFTRRYRWLLPLSFLFVWLYDAFPLIIIITGIYVISVGLIEHRIELRPLIFAGLGVGLGLLVNPYFPDNVIFAYRHILPKLTEATAVSVGNEWYPYRTTTLLKNSPMALIAMLGGALALGLQERRMDTRALTSFLVAIFFGLLLFQSRRFIEYFPPFALVFAAFACAPLLASRDGSIHSEKPALPGSVSLPISSGFWPRGMAWLPSAAFGLLLLAGMVYTVIDAQKLMQSASRTGRYAKVAAWLEQNTPTGERIFQTDWDDFPRLFFHNTHNTYLIGLDPTYMQLFDAALYDQWVDITQGDVELPSAFIQSLFDTSYVMSDLNHKDFIDQAEADPGMELVYRDDEAVVFRITD
jgi:hypothetical protein